MKDKRLEHTLMIEGIKDHPNYLGVDKVVISAGATILWGGEKFYAEADGLLFLRDRSICIVEYKSSDTFREMAIAQLRKNMVFIKGYFNREVHGLYVHNVGGSLKNPDLVTEEVSFN